MNLLGIDIGGTKTAVCVGTEKGDIAASQRIAMRADEPMADYIGRLSDLCHGVLKEAGVRLDRVKAVGISAPGPLDARQGLLIAPPNNPTWHNAPITALVSEELGRPLFLNNDANAAALAELYFGGHKGKNNLVYLTFSTGMGGGIIVNGELVQGVTDMGGEVGHMVLDPNGPACGCGQRGCWEVYVGGRMVAERLKARLRGGAVPTKIIEKAGGNVERITMRALEEAVREGDPIAMEEWDGLVERLAQGIGILIMTLNPEVIVLGTIAIHAHDLIMAPLRTKLKRYAWKWPLDACEILPSTLGAKIAELAGLAVALDGMGHGPLARARPRAAQLSP
jgi:glucokinase